MIPKTTPSTAWKEGPSLLPLVALRQVLSEVSLQDPKITGLSRKRRGGACSILAKVPAAQSSLAPSSLPRTITEIPGGRMAKMCGCPPTCRLRFDRHCWRRQLGLAVPQGATIRRSLTHKHHHLATSPVPSPAFHRLCHPALLTEVGTHQVLDRMPCHPSTEPHLLRIKEKMEYQSAGSSGAHTAIRNLVIMPFFAPSFRTTSATVLNCPMMVFQLEGIAAL